MTVLVLGGTREARQLATALHAGGDDVLTSLAGRTAAPVAIPGRTRSGGFGGAPGLAAFLRDHAIAGVIDATHPYAARMAANAHAATAVAGVPLLRLERAPWPPGPGWQVVDDAVAAAAALPRGSTALLALGRQELAAFAGRHDVAFVVRSVDPPADGAPRPRRCAVVLGRGPFSLQDELALLAVHDVDVLVTRDSGGPAAKLRAARERGLPVIVLRRPARPPATTVHDVAAAVAWARHIRAG